MRIDIVTKSPNLISKILICGLLASGFGCQNKLSSINEIDLDVSPQACLEFLDLKFLEQTLEHCNKIVERYKNNAAPIIDRSLIYILMDRDSLACKDVKSALIILENQGKGSNPLLLDELIVRQYSCMDRLNMADKD